MKSTTLSRLEMMRRRPEMSSSLVTFHLMGKAEPVTVRLPRDPPSKDESLEQLRLIAKELAAIKGALIEGTQSRPMLVTVMD